MGFVAPEDREAAQEVIAGQVIAALDPPTMQEALALVDRIGGGLEYYKIGSRLFTKHGPAILDELAARGKRVFLDLKLYDIPSVVGDAVENIAGHEAVFLTTVHASGGEKMVKAAVEGAERGGGSLKVIAVTALTSFSAAQLPALGITSDLDAWAEQLGAVALGAGAHGLVSSAQEAERLRTLFGEEPLLVTPGIRLGAGRVAGDDQQRVLTPRKALERGSSYLVIGRPIYSAEDPVRVLEEIASSLLSEEES